jgi:hypothetical protein
MKRNTEILDKSEQPLENESSPISFVPPEVLSHIFNFLPLWQNRQIQEVNQLFKDIWRIELRQQMNTLSPERGIEEPISSEAGFNALWASQQVEIDYMLQGEKVVLKKTNHAQSVIGAYKKLKAVKDRSKSALSLQARERVLEDANKSIITAHIEICKEREDKSLNCSYSFLTRFSEDLIEQDLSFWQKIRGISFANNQLSLIPKKISECKELKKLWLQNNKLSFLPESIGNCLRLKELDLGNNLLTSLPDTLGNCVDIQYLVISNNHISTLSETIGNYVALEWLFASNNKIISIPESIGKCTYLIQVDVSHNLITSLPATLCECVELRWLYAKNNQLSSLPQNIGQCVELTEVLLCNNQIMSLPESLKECSLLESIGLENNCLISLPELRPDVRFVDSSGISTTKRQVATSQRLQSHSISKKRFGN